MHQDIVITPPFRRIHVVTFSGAHGVGKTTLCDDVTTRLTEAGYPVVKNESISTAWFNRTKADRAKAGLPPLSCYDDINRLGLRQQCQKELIDHLWVAVVNGIMDAIDKLNNSKADAAFVMSDRWFCDIYAYTAMECSDQAFVHQQYEIIRPIVSKLYSDAMKRVLGVGMGLAATHVFIPLDSCAHVAQDDKPNRGTCDPVVWQQHCMRILPSTCRNPQLLAFSVGDGDRVGRSGRLFDRLVG